MGSFPFLHSVLILILKDEGKENVDLWKYIGIVLYSQIQNEWRKRNFRY